ncbi:MAG: hypothetical protein CSB01_03960 [Bacteroidia bacterium]|nr:MAG: hypothetical protein CSB01_03960 [Bacteroidia bacterium]
MIKKVISLLLLLYCFVSVAFAVDFYSNTGARSVALGQSSSCFRDVWSVVNNQAGLAFIANPTLGIFYEERFGMKEMSVKSVAFALPTNRVGNFGVSFTYFGDKYYNESRINLGYGRMLGKHFAIGLAFDYFAMSVEGNSQVADARALTGEVGVMVEPIENLWISAHAYNPFGVNITNGEYEEKLPVLLRLGAMYSFEKDLLFVVELEKELDYKMRLKTGVEYTFLEQFVVRGGVATNPTEFSGGIGVKLQRFNLDLSFYRHQYLGYTPAVALVYAFGK